MDILTAIKIRNLDGTYSDPIPISALAENIVYDKDHTLLDAIGTINIDELGSLQDQILELKQRGIDAATASANQIPVADGHGSWHWENKVENSDEVINLSDVPGKDVTQALDNINYLAQSNKEIISNINSSTVPNSSSVQGDTVTAALNILSNQINDITGTINITLSKDSYTFTMDSSGTIDYTNCYTDIQVFRDDTEITKRCSYRVEASEGINGVWIPSINRYKVLSMSNVTNGIVTFNVTYEGTSLIKVFSITLVSDGQSAIRTEIESSAGNIFRNNNVSTTLTCRVYRGSDEITNQVTSFIWQKYNANGTLDPNWQRPLAGNVINITNADVYDRAIFRCKVTI